jgi:glycogen operon protein
MSSVLLEKSEIGKRFPASGQFHPVNPQGWAIATFPLGAHYDGQTVTFAVFSKRATHILLEIYNAATGQDAVYDYWLAKNPQDDIWRAQVADIPPGTLYGFRCWGPNWEFHAQWQRGNSDTGFMQDIDAEGNRFNPNKVLFDPYARELSHDKETPAMLQTGENGGMFATGSGDYKGVPSRNFDTGRWAPKGIVLAPEPTPIGDRPFLPPEKAIIYEAHVRGLTQHPSASRLQIFLKDYPEFGQVVNVPEAYRGTYVGAAYMAKYLKALGFTTIELLPVHETANDTNSEDQPGGNYWGYMTFGYFAPDRRYAYDKSPGGPTREFKQMVKAFHDEGMEVYLDVVFNHTGEGGNWGNNDVVAFHSFGGFDAPEYYQLTNIGYLVDGATGCGNQLNFSNAVTQNLVLDSLTYWITEMGVDGFRFDLAPVLGRTPNEFERENWNEQKRFFQRHTLLDRIKDLGDAHRAEMIAEAWDIWGYEVGNFPAGWGEWNGRYRDAVRRFMKGDGNTDYFIQQINGDYQNFNDQGGPQRSVDFLVAHDGFTLMDLVSYNRKNNLTSWPFGPSDGGNDSNDSWDSGGNQALRRQRLRNFWAIQFFSRGVPMTVWGDEFGRTQNGNNNPYNIDSVATWNNYAMLGTHAPNRVATGYPGDGYHDNFGAGKNTDGRNPLFVFVRYVTQLRNQHPALQQRQYADLVMNSGGDVTYQFKKTDGQTNLEGHDLCIWLRIDGSEVRDHDFLLLINMYSESVTFQIPADPGRQWRRIIDTAAWAEFRHNIWFLTDADLVENDYCVSPFSIVVLEEVNGARL